MLEQWVPPGELMRQRVQTLQRTFQRIAEVRMAGIPVLNRQLHVQCVGFTLDPMVPDMAWGVLITPWFMNLIRLPLRPQGLAHLPELCGKQQVEWQGNTLDFIGAEESWLGESWEAHYALSPLFSPMQSFESHHAALETAQAVVRMLAPVEPPPAAAAVAERTAHPAHRAMPVAALTAPTPNPPQRDAGAPARRGFLLGRRPATSATDGPARKDGR